MSKLNIIAGTNNHDRFEDWGQLFRIVGHFIININLELTKLMFPGVLKQNWESSLEQPSADWKHSKYPLPFLHSSV